MQIMALLNHFFKLIPLILTNIPLIIAGLIGFGLLVFIHELGHFLFCKLFSVSTPSFSIGFGPRIFSKKIGETEFVISALPGGGYVEIAGAQEVGQGDQKEAARKDRHSFAVKPYYQKMLILAGGIVFNLIFAYVVIISLALVGLPDYTTTIKTVTPDSAADKAGIKAHDYISAINNELVADNVQVLLQKLDTYKNQEIQVMLARDGNMITIPVQLASRLGVEFEMQEKKALPFMEAIRHGIASTNSIIINTVMVLKNMFACKSVNGLGGPLRVFSETIKGASKGLKIFFLLLAIISVNLAIINIVPLPIFDGGQALFYTIEAITGRPLADRTRYMIHYITWICVIALIIFLSFKDTLYICKTYFN